jgi:hypothetical protein
VLRSPPSTFIPFLSKVSALKQRCPLMSARSNPSTARSAPRSSSIALRYDPSTVGAGWAYSLVVPRTAVLAERDRWVAAFVGAKSETRITLIYPALESSRHAAAATTACRQRLSTRTAQCAFLAMRRRGRPSGDDAVVVKVDRPKRMAAARAIEEVQDSMILGLGKGIDRRIRDRGPGSINVRLLKSILTCCGLCAGRVAAAAPANRAAESWRASR